MPASDDGNEDLITIGGIGCSLISITSSNQKIPCYRHNSDDWMVPITMLQQVHFPNQKLGNVERIVHMFTEGLKRMNHMEINAIKEWMKMKDYNSDEPGITYPALTEAELACRAKSVEANYGKVLETVFDTTSFSKLKRTSTTRKQTRKFKKTKKNSSIQQKQPASAKFNDRGEKNLPARSLKTVKKFEEDMPTKKVNKSSDVADLPTEYLRTTLKKSPVVSTTASDNKTAVSLSTKSSKKCQKDVRKSEIDKAKSNNSMQTEKILGSNVSATKVTDKVGIKREEQAKTLSSKPSSSIKPKPSFKKSNKPTTENTQITKIDSSTLNPSVLSNKTEKYVKNTASNSRKNQLDIKNDRKQVSLEESKRNKRKNCESLDQSNVSKENNNAQHSTKLQASGSMQNCDENKSNKKIESGKKPLSPLSDQNLPKKNNQRNLARQSNVSDAKKISSNSQISASTTGTKLPAEESTSAVESKSSPSSKKQIIFPDENNKNNNHTLPCFDHVSTELKEQDVKSKRNSTEYETKENGSLKIRNDRTLNRQRNFRFSHGFSPFHSQFKLNRFSSLRRTTPVNLRNFYHLKNKFRNTSYFHRNSNIRQLHAENRNVKPKKCSIAEEKCREFQSLDKSLDSAQDRSRKISPNIAIPRKTLLPSPDYPPFERKVWIFDRNTKLHDNRPFHDANEPGRPAEDIHRFSTNENGYPSHYSEDVILPQKTEFQYHDNKFKSGAVFYDSKTPIKTYGFYSHYNRYRHPWSDQRPFRKPFYKNSGFNSYYNNKQQQTFLAEKKEDEENVDTEMLGQMKQSEGTSIIPKQMHDANNLVKPRLAGHQEYVRRVQRNSPISSKGFELPQEKKSATTVLENRRKNVTKEDLSVLIKYFRSHAKHNNGGKALTRKPTLKTLTANNSKTSSNTAHATSKNVSKKVKLVKKNTPIVTTNSLSQTGENADKSTRINLSTTACIKSSTVGKTCTEFKQENEKPRFPRKGAEVVTTDKSCDDDNKTTSTSNCVASQSKSFDGETTTIRQQNAIDPQKQKWPFAFRLDEWSNDIFSNFKINTDDETLASEEICSKEKPTKLNVNKNIKQWKKRMLEKATQHEDVAETNFNKGENSPNTNDAKIVHELMINMLNIVCDKNRTLSSVAETCSKTLLAAKLPEDVKADDHQTTNSNSSDIVAELLPKQPTISTEATKELETSKVNNCTNLQTNFNSNLTLPSNAIRNNEANGNGKNVNVLKTNVEDNEENGKMNPDDIHLNQTFQKDEKVSFAVAQVSVNKPSDDSICISQACTDELTTNLHVSNNNDETKSTCKSTKSLHAMSNSEVSLCNNATQNNAPKDFIIERVEDNLVSRNEYNIALTDDDDDEKAYETLSETDISAEEPAYEQGQSIDGYKWDASSKAIHIRDYAKLSRKNGQDLLKKWNVKECFVNIERVHIATDAKETPLTNFTGMLSPNYAPRLDSSIQNQQTHSPTVNDITVPALISTKTASICLRKHNTELSQESSMGFNNEKCLQKKKARKTIYRPKKAMETEENITSNEDADIQPAECAIVNRTTNQDLNSQENMPNYKVVTRSLKRRKHLPSISSDEEDLITPLADHKKSDAEKSPKTPRSKITNGIIEEDDRLLVSCKDFLPNADKAYRCLVPDIEFFAKNLKETDLTNNAEDSAATAQATDKTESKVQKQNKSKVTRTYPAKPSNKLLEISHKTTFKSKEVESCVADRNKSYVEKLSNDWNDDSESQNLPELVVEFIGKIDSDANSFQSKCNEGNVANLKSYDAKNNQGEFQNENSTNFDMIGAAKSSEEVFESESQSQHSAVSKCQSNFGGIQASDDNSTSITAGSSDISKKVETSLSITENPNNPIDVMQKVKDQKNKICDEKNGNTRIMSDNTSTPFIDASSSSSQLAPPSTLTLSIKPRTSLPSSERSPINSLVSETIKTATSIHTGYNTGSVLTANADSSSVRVLTATTPVLELCSPASSSLCTVTPTTSSNNFNSNVKQAKVDSDPLTSARSRYSSFTSTVNTPAHSSITDKSNWSGNVSQTCSHGIMEIEMSAPATYFTFPTTRGSNFNGKVLFLCRRIPYVQITVQTPCLTTSSNGLSSFSHQSETAKCSSTKMQTAYSMFVRIKDVAFTLLQQPSDVISVIQFHNIQCFLPNDFTNAVYNLIYDPVSKLNHVMIYSLTDSSKNNRNTGTINGDCLIYLNDYLKVILPEYFLNNFSITHDKLPEYVSVKTYQSIKEINENVIQIFSTSFAYNDTLIKQDIPKAPTRGKKSRNCRTRNVAKKRKLSNETKNLTTDSEVGSRNIEQSRGCHNRKFDFVALPTTGNLQNPTLAFQNHSSINNSIRTPRGSIGVILPFSNSTSSSNVIQANPVGSAIYKQSIASDSTNHSPFGLEMFGNERNISTSVSLGLTTLYTKFNRTLPHLSLSSPISHQRYQSNFANASSFGASVANSQGFSQACHTMSTKAPCYTTATKLPVRQMHQSYNDLVNNSVKSPAGTASLINTQSIEISDSNSRRPTNQQQYSVCMTPVVEQVSLPNNVSTTVTVTTTNQPNNQDNLSLGAKFVQSVIKSIQPANLSLLRINANDNKLRQDNSFSEIFSDSRESKLLGSYDSGTDKADTTLSNSTPSVTLACQNYQQSQFKSTPSNVLCDNENLVVKSVYTLSGKRKLCEGMTTSEFFNDVLPNKPSQNPTEELSGTEAKIKILKKSLEEVDVLTTKNTNKEKKSFYNKWRLRSKQKNKTPLNNTLKKLRRRVRDSNGASVNLQ